MESKAGGKVIHAEGPPHIKEGPFSLELQTVNITYKSTIWTVKSDLFNLDNLTGGCNCNRNVVIFSCKCSDYFKGAETVW